MKAAPVSWLLAAGGVVGMLVVALMLRSGPQPQPVEVAPTAEPALRAPGLPDGLRSIGEGTLALEVLPESKQAIDALGLARQSVTEVPTCAQLVFFFTWRVGEGQLVRFTGNRMGGSWDVATGQTGEARMTGCALLEAINLTTNTVTGQLHYILASSGP